MNNIHEQCPKQCIESKLSRVHSAPTFGPACAHTAPCRRPGMAVSSARLAILQAVSQRAAVVSQHYIATLARCIATQSLPLSHDIIFCIATPPSQIMCAHALPHAPHSGRPYRGPNTPCRGRGLAVSWPCPGCAQANLPSLVSR